MTTKAHKSASSWPATRFALGTRYDRFAIAPGLDGWIYSYDGAHGSRAGAVSPGIELGIHLRGGWRQRRHGGGEAVFGSGDVHVLNPGDHYDLAFCADEAGGTLVGLNIDPERLLGFEAPDADLLVTPGTEGHARLLDLAWSLHGSYRRDGLVPAGAAEAIREHLARRTSLSPRDGLRRAKRELDRFFAHELYLDQIAEVAAMPRRSFIRGFSRRFGVTPIQYRIKQRLNHVARQLWAEPQLSVAEIGRRCGFDNTAYLHRAFLADRGTTPATYRQRAFDATHR